MGALSAASIPIARTRRVSIGSITPSSHSRAVEWYGEPSRSYLSRIGASNASRSASVSKPPRTVERTRAAWAPPMTLIRALGHIQSWRGPYARISVMGGAQAAADDDGELRNVRRAHRCHELRAIARDPTGLVLAA